MTEAKSPHLQVCETIMRQIRKNDLMACGARNFIAHPEGEVDGMKYQAKLAFRVTVRDRDCRFIEVLYRWDDTYTVRLVRLTRATAANNFERKLIVERQIEDVYCDMLSDVIYGACNRDTNDLK